MTLENLKMKAIELAEEYKDDIDKEEIKMEVESFKYHALSMDMNMRTATPASLLSLVYKHRLQE